MRSIVFNVFLPRSLFFIALSMPGLVRAENLYRELVTISSYEMEIVTVASRKLQELHADWRNYQISIIETDSTFEVTFWLPEKMRTERFFLPATSGKTEKTISSREVAHGALVVELEKKALAITGFSHIK